MLVRLILLFLFTLVMRGANSITIKDTSGAAQTNRPFTISRVFARGEIAHYPKAVIGGNQITTQADVKTRWPDGSVQHAMISFLASVGAGASITVDFVDQASGNNTGQMDKAAILAANWGARIEATANAMMQAADARQIVTDWPGTSADKRVTYWLSGAICTQVILEDQSTALQYDMGWDTYKPLHPIFVVTLYPGYTAGVKVEMILENEWTTKLEDQTYSLSLKTGKTPAQVYAKNNYLHAAKTRWRKVFWVGTAPKSVNVDYNLPYMISTQAVPNWDTSVVVAPGTVSGAVNAFNASDKCDLGGHGLWTQYLPQTGGRPDIGTVPVWYAQYLFTMDAGMLNLVLGQAACAGYIPTHFRESETTRFFDAAKMINAFGRPISVDARPTTYIDLSRTDMTSGADRITPVGPTTKGGWTDDIAHQPGWNYIPYLITGDWYLLQELYQFATADLMYAAPGFADYQRGNQFAYFNWAIQSRGQAWGLRDLAHAAFAAPDGSPEKAYYTEKVNFNIAINEGFHNIRNGAFPPADPNCTGYNAGAAASKWCFGRVTVAHNFNNPLRFFNAGGIFTQPCSPVDPHFVPANDPLACFTADAPWEIGYALNVVGHIQELGFAIGPLNVVQFTHLLHQVSDPAYNPYLAGAYQYPVQRKTTSQYYQTWADLKNAFTTAWNDGCGNTYNLRTVNVWTENCGGGGDQNTSAPGYPHIMRGASSYLAGLAIDDGPLLGANAWTWMNTHVQPGSGANPVYIVLPRSYVPPNPTPGNKCDLNSDGKVDSLDVQLSIVRVLGGTGSSTDTQRIINAALGAACP